MRSYGLVFLLPAVVLIFSFRLKFAAGPFWQYADPSYIFLLNSVNLVKGIPAAFFDQPGVPLQSLGQAVILFLNIGHSSADAVKSVLVNPEYYLNIIDIVLLLLIFLTSILLGAYTFRKTNDIAAVFLSQLPNVLLLTLRSNQNHPWVYATVNAEPLLLCITNLFNIFLLKLFFSKTDKEKNLSILILGFICGLGVATKLSFLTLLILPLIICRWRMKPAFILTTIAFFVLWTLPIITLYPKLWSWIAGLITHTGIYGNGHGGVIDIHDYLAAWNVIFQKFWFYVLFALCTLVISSIEVLKRRSPPASFFIWAISFTILVQLAVVAKHFEEHYLVIAINSFGPLFVLFYLYQMPKRAFLKPLILLLIGLSTLFSSIITSTYAYQLAHLTKEVVHFNDIIHTKYPGCLYIGSYLKMPISNPEYALFMGNDSSGGGEKEELSRIYPNNFSLFTESLDISGTCTYGLYNFKQSLWADDLLSSYPCIIFINSGYNFPGSPYIVKPLEEGEYSKAYLLVGSTEKEANALFNMALQLIRKGDYAQAMAYLLKSRELHFQPGGEIDYFIGVLYSQLKH